MSGESAGSMKDRVGLLQRVGTSGTAGESAGEFQLILERWARVEPSHRAVLSAVESDARLTARRWRFTLRAGPKVELDMRVRWRGVMMQLIGIESDPGRPAELVLLAEELGN